MKSVSTEYVESLVNFAATERASRMGFAESQLHGATAAFNMLQRNGVAYLADEVGMGKTYVALATMALLRFQNPSARILVVTPRENIQQKWKKELRNFVRNNWINVDNCVKSFGDRPVREPVTCGSVADFAATLRYREHADIILRATSFSVATSDRDRRKKLKRQLLSHLPWVDRGLLSVKERDRDEFRDAYARIFNALIPDIDLLVIDESHNFKHGFGPKVSNRNRVLGMALGHPNCAHPDFPWYRPRVKNLLLLSATPFEYDYADIQRQLDVFGKANLKLRKPNSSEIYTSKTLLDGDESEKRAVARKLLIRRTQYIKIGDRQLSKNQYRRDWREGGYEQHDKPIVLSDPKERLVVGLMQKKVAEVLGDEKFNNSFQIGMLSSFESFMESLSRKKKKDENSDSDESVFDGDQDATLDEKQGVDTEALNQMVRSYKERFGQKLPHPKLDATANSLANAFTSGNKSLVFVRRVATVGELKSKLEFHYDRWLLRKLLVGLPDHSERINSLFDHYREESLNGSHDEVASEKDHEESRREEALVGADLDPGGTDNFFAWFFRGSGPKGVLSGAAFQKNRLSSTSSAYATIFEDNHVGLVLGRPANPYEALCLRLGKTKEQLNVDLKNTAFRYFKSRSRQKTGYPRLYVLESYQYAALSLLAEKQDDFGKKASNVLRLLYRQGHGNPIPPPQGFPDAEPSINVKTFFTELAERPELRKRIWACSDCCDDLNSLKEQETRRILISTVVRLGASFIDLYIEAIKLIGSFDLRVEAKLKTPEVLLFKSFLDVLDVQRKAVKSSFNAFYELSEISESFDVLLDVNFPDAREASLGELAVLFARTMQHQEPVGGMSGGVNKRMVKQFRMPGYPLVLASTDVLQEGEDLHTYCRNVVHYGVAWTPSAVEQRTGRVDRIHSLLQRNLDGADREPSPSEFIQVHFPHLCDTVERLQVKNVLERLNRFTELIHKDVDKARSDESRIDVDREILKQAIMPSRIEQKLESDFPVVDEWLAGQLDDPDNGSKNLAVEYETEFGELCKRLSHHFHAGTNEQLSNWRYVGRIAIWKGSIVPWERNEKFIDRRIRPFTIELRSQVTNEKSLIRFSSPIGLISNLPDQIDHLYDLQRSHLNGLRLCLRPEKSQFQIAVECDRIFDFSTLQFEELTSAFNAVMLAADAVQLEFLDANQLEVGK